MKKASAFLLGLVCALALAQAITLKFRNACYLSVASETGRISLEWQRYQARDLNLPSVILLGGSDMREAVDMDLARAYFQERGYSFFNFAISAQEPMVEKFQMLSAIDLHSADRVIFTLGYQEFEEDDLVNPVSEGFELPSAYLERMKVFGQSASLAEYALKAMNQLFPWLKERDPLRLCLLPKKSNEPYRWHNSGAAPEPLAETEQKLAKYQLKKIDDKYSFREDSPRYRLLQKIYADHGNQIVMAEGPRNPRLSKVYSEGFFARFEKFVGPFRPRSLTEGIELQENDFFDFNHLTTTGSTRITREALPLWFSLIKGEQR